MNDSTDYIYEKNILGDIMHVYTLATKESVGVYTYDAWGRTQAYYYPSVNNALEIVRANPFRYRGYYCDTET